MDRKIGANGFSIVLITEQDRDSVLAFLRKHFWEDEPMNESLVLGECKALEHFCWKDVKDNLSFQAIDGNGNCVGVFLSALSYIESESGHECETDHQKLRRQQMEADDLVYQSHEKFYRIIRLTEQLDKRVNLASRCSGLRECVDGKVISVDKKLRGQGIAGQLVKRTLKEMEERNLPLMCIQCSSFYSAQVMLKLGFELVAEIPFKEFFLDGKQAINPKAPHEKMTAFIKWAKDGEMRRSSMKGKSTGV